MYVKTVHGNLVNSNYIVSVNVEGNGEEYCVRVETVIGNKRKVFKGTQEECKRFVENLYYEAL